MTVAFKELAGSPLETFDPDGMKAERRILVAWEHRHAMVAELLGSGYEFGGFPQAPYPNRPSVVAVRARLEPWPKHPDQQGAFSDIASELNSYSGKYAEIVVSYELLDASHKRKDLPKPHQGTFLTYRMDFGAEYLKLPEYCMDWVTGPVSGVAPVPPDAVPTLRVPITEHHVTWHRVLNPPWQAIRERIGTVNSAPFMGAPAETVLFDGATADKRFVGLDDLEQPQFGWQIAYVFREKAVKYDGGPLGELTAGWNHAFRPLPFNQPDWDKLQDGNGQPLYRATDFTPLFQFAVDL